MKLLSQIFQPVITIPKGAKIKNTEITCKSQKLLLECGLVRPTSSGLFTLLPLARRALTKLENIIHRCLEEVGAQRISLPCLTSSKLWEESGRLENFGSELMKVEDRHKKKYILGPTHEEAIADLLSDVAPIPHKQLPLILYQIGNKYRDEVRPKHGLLRAREFLMMDAYSVHTHADCALHTYDALTHAYRNVFRELELPAARVEAPCGDMGGSLSHEWQLPAPSGEDALAVCSSCGRSALAGEGSGGCHTCGREMDICNSIEVGHTFVLGDRYSAPLVMACYGIGLTRLLSASIELRSTERSLRWPHAIAPYDTIVIGPKEGSKEWVIHESGQLQQLIGHVCGGRGQGDVVVDDRHHLTIGKRLHQADKTGYPNIVVCGRSALERPPRYELHRPGGEALTLTVDELMAVIHEKERDNTHIEHIE